MKKLLQTPSQTVGPYFAYGLTPQQYGYDHRSAVTNTLVGDDTEGPRIVIEGRVLDGNGQPIPDAMVELWQPDIKAFGRMGTGTDAHNRFIFNTIKPKSFDGQAPHLVVIVFMRGLLVHAYTRLYFADEKKANTKDRVLRTVPAERRDTLLATPEVRNGQTVYHFDIHMQGDTETVFFDL